MFLILLCNITSFKKWCDITLHTRHYIQIVYCHVFAHLWCINCCEMDTQNLTPEWNKRYCENLSAALRMESRFCQGYLEHRRKDITVERPHLLKWCDRGKSTSFSICTLKSTHVETLFRMLSRQSSAGYSMVHPIPCLWGEMHWNYLPLPFDFVLLGWYHVSIYVCYPRSNFR